MSTVIVCSECENPIDVIGDTISLPFVCNQCQAEAEEFQEKIAPKTEPLHDVIISSHEGDPGDEHEHVHNGGDFDATNQLIADLTQALERSNETTGSLTETVRDLTQRLSEAGELIDDLSNQLTFERNVTDRVIEVNDELHKKLNASWDACQKLGNRVAELTNQNIDAENELSLANDRADRYIKAWQLASQEILFYLSRGFWARVFNARYKTSGQF